MFNIKRFAALTNQGPFLKTNEDFYDTDIENGLFLILDGIGGAGIGDTFVHQCIQQIKHYYLHLVDDPENTMPFFYHPHYLLETNALLNSLKRFHMESFKQNQEKDITNRAAASILATTFSDHICTMINMGNTMAYLHRMDTITPIFSENNFGLFNNDVKSKFMRNIPQNAMGLFDYFNFELRELKIFPKDRILFLTDGVYSLLSTSEMQSMLIQKYDNLNQLIQRIFDYVNGKGNIDNQTAIIIEF